MTFRLLDMARVTSSAAPGTGNFTSVSAVTGFQTPVAAGAAVGDTFSYGIFDGNNREVGIATVLSSGGIARTIVTYSTNGGAAINASATAQLYATASAASLQPDGLSGWVNAFRNMGCDVDQRQTRSSAMTVTTSGAYVTDGDIVLPTGASVSAGQAAAQSGMLSANSLKVTGATSCTGITVRRRIESIEVARAGLVGINVTFQCKVYNNSGGSITPTLSVGHPSTADTYSSVGASALTNELNAQSLQSCPNGQVTTLSYTLTLSSNAANGLEFNLNLGNNFSSSSKTAQVTDWDMRATPALPTGTPSVLPPPELRPYAAEFLNCQRHLPGVCGDGPWAPFSATGISGGCTPSLNGKFLFTFRVPTRIAPTGVSSAGATATVTFSAASPSAATLITSGCILALSGTTTSAFLVFTGAEL